MSEAVLEQQPAVAEAGSNGRSGIMKMIPLSRIRENPVALRAVNRQSDEYLELVDSIRTRGVLNAILVREIKDQQSGETLYGLIDGLHRFSGAQDAGLTEIPAQVRSMEESAILEAQIVANIHKIETKPVEYSKQLMRILAHNPTLTLAELAVKLAKSPSWLADRLYLVKLPEEIGALVDEGRINLSNGYALAKLAAVAPDEVNNFLDRAMTMAPLEFVPTIKGRIKEIRDSKRKGQDATPEEFVPHPVLRKLTELKDEMNTQKAAQTLVREHKITNPVESFNLALRWALQMDPSTLEARKQKEADRQKEMEAEKERRRVQREKDKQERDRKKAAEISFPI